MIGGGLLMGIAPAEFWQMTPAEFFLVQEAWLERQGGYSVYGRRRALAKNEALKRRFPDDPPPASSE